MEAPFTSYLKSTQSSGIYLAELRWPAVRKAVSLTASTLGLLLLSSCREEPVAIYDIPKEDSFVTSSAEGGISGSALPRWNLTWETPASWETESPPPTARYRPTEEAQVTVTRLAGEGGGMLANITRWRGQGGLKPLAGEDPPEPAVKVTLGGNLLSVFEINAPANEPGIKSILAGILPLDGETWFFKFTAAEAILKKHRGEFLTFLRSVKIAPEAPPSTATNPPQPETQRLPELIYSSPEEWQRSEGSAMRVASFSVTGSETGAADIAIVPLPGDAGSRLENANWWRKQLRLEPLEAGAEEETGQILKGKMGEFFLMHLQSSEPLLENGSKAAISAAMIKQGGYTWFFKMTGDADTVRENRKRFESFVQSAAIP